jgi:hypothetical protein
VVEEAEGAAVAAKRLWGEEELKKPLNLAEVAEGDEEAKVRLGSVRRSRVALATETRRAIGFDADSIMEVKVFFV